MRFSVIAAAVMASGAASAQVLNGGFEEPGLGFRSVANGQTWGNWTCSGPNDIEYVKAEPNGALFNLDKSAYEGSYWIDLCGVGQASGIYQNVQNLEAGSTYRISFAQAGNVWGANFNFVMNVLWNDQVVGTFSSVHGGSNGANMNWQLRDVDVVAQSGVNKLGFKAVTATAARGAAIDAVKLTLVPTPGAGAVLAMGGVLLSRRRRA
jgi:hypothetical protein